MSDSLNNSDRERAELEQLHASCYPANQPGLPVEELDRLFDLDSEPQRDDYKAVVRCAPQMQTRLDLWLEGRLGLSKWVAWQAECARQLIEELPERMASAKFRAAQISNRSDADKLEFAKSLIARRREADFKSEPAPVAPVPLRALPPDFGLPESKLVFNGKEVVQAARDYAEAAGITRGVSRSQTMQLLALFEERRQSGRRHQTYNLSRDEVIEFFRELFAK